MTSDEIKQSARLQARLKKDDDIAAVTLQATQPLASDGTPLGSVLADGISKVLARIQPPDGEKGGCQL